MKSLRDFSNKFEMPFFLKDFNFVGIALLERKAEELETYLKNIDVMEIIKKQSCTGISLKAKELYKLLTNCKTNIRPHFTEMKTFFTEAEQEG